jgi:nucleoid DNA-binding protein
LKERINNMKKNEMVQLYAEKKEVTKKAVEELLANIDGLLEAVIEGLEVGEKVKVGQYFTVEKVHKEEKSGECNGKPYTTPAHTEAFVKRTSLLKNI